MERTLIILKPDAIQRSIAGEVITRFERRGLRIVGMKLMQITKATAEEHYAEHKDKPFFAGTVAYMTSSPVIVMVLEGPNAVLNGRGVIGATNPVQAAAGSIRADYALDISRNVVHGSDKPETAEREIGIYFKPEELVSYTRVTDTWLTE